MRYPSIYFARPIVNGNLLLLFQPVHLHIDVYIRIPLAHVIYIFRLCIICYNATHWFINKSICMYLCVDAISNICIYRRIYNNVLSYSLYQYIYIYIYILLYHIYCSILYVVYCIYCSLL